MRTFKFSYYLVNAEKVGYLTQGFCTKTGVAERYVAILVDGVELREYFKDYGEQNKRYKEVEQFLKCK